jgi:hypothetical protein
MGRFEIGASKLGVMMSLGVSVTLAAGLCRVFLLERGTHLIHSGELVVHLALDRRIVQLHREIQAKNRLAKETASTDALTDLLTHLTPKSLL